MTKLGAANVVDKAPKLLAQSNKNLILILHGLCAVEDMLAMHTIRSSRGARLVWIRGGRWVS